MSRALAGGLLWVTVALLLREALEASMLGHALVQLPALVVAGWLLVPRRDRTESRFATPVLLVALFSAAVWMLPRMLDGALAQTSVEIAKLVTVPLLVGLPLGWSWPRLTSLSRAFVWANGISMLLTLGWLYQAAPTRVCNYYRLEEQSLVGGVYLALAAGLTLLLLPPLFLGTREVSDAAGLSTGDSGAARGGGASEWPPRETLA